MENSMEVLQKNKKYDYHMIQQFHSWVFIWRKWKHYPKYLHSIFIEKLFTTAKPWKQPKCSSMTWMNKENVIHTYSRILFHQKKEESLAICNNMDWLWGHSLVAQTVNNLPSVHKTRVWSLGREDSLEKRMATHSTILAWRIPWTEEPGGLQSMVS